MNEKYTLHIIVIILILFNIIQAIFNIKALDVIEARHKYNEHALEEYYKNNEDNLKKLKASVTVQYIEELEQFSRGCRKKLKELNIPNDFATKQ
jgi:hypothetical protein